MSIAIRDRRDPVAEHAPLPGLMVKREEDVVLMAALQERAFPQQRALERNLWVLSPLPWKRRLRLWREQARF